MNPLYYRAKYLISASAIWQAPEDSGHEVAFAGRSNAGKSSAINAITNQKALARTSKTPGRTQLLNFFGLDERHRLVDLPGYGYAKVPDKIQRDWGRSMEDYLTLRQSLRGVFLLMDIRHPLTDFDWQLIGWCNNRSLPLHVALTKADKLSRGAGKGVLLKVQAMLSQEATVPISLQLFSAPARQGIDEAHACLDHWLQLEAPAGP